MGQDEYISIAEFARRAGITPQAVYKQLNNQVDNQLSTYTKIHNGKKRIHIKALELFLSTGVNQVVNQFNNQVDNQINQVVDFLKDQIKRKDIQIEQLQQDLRTSREDLTRLATELAKIADQGQHLQMKMMLPDGQQNTQQPEETGTAAPIQDAEVISESSQEEQHPIDGGKVKEEVMWEGNHQQPINWWMVVAIVAIIALIAGVVYYLWDTGLI